jgi:Rhamnan synthesis protein F
VIETWKIVREADRLRLQILAAAGPLWEPWVQRRYDRSRDQNLTVTQGEREVGTKVAIYLIYEPNGVLASTIEACRLLEAAGYAPLVVSNAPLDAAALATLTPLAWRIIQRPNYGYDFGGYRDGILHVVESGIVPDRLLVMNDSIWYPLGGVDTLLPRLEASGLDVAGTLVHRAFRKGLRRRRPIRVIESYLFLFNRKAFESPAFRTFWRGYRLSSNKVNAVRRGERRLAEAMLAGGLTADGIFGAEDFLQMVAREDDCFLRKTIRYAAYTDAELEDEACALLAEGPDTPGWRDRTLAHITRVVAQRNFHGSFVFATARLLDIPFLKKGTSNMLKRTYGTLYARMRDQYLAAVEARDLPPPRGEVLAEIQRLQGMLRPSG